MKNTETVASNNEHRDSTVNKGTNSQLTSEYLNRTNGSHKNHCGWYSGLVALIHFSIGIKSI